MKTAAIVLEVPCQTYSTCADKYLVIGKNLFRPSFSFLRSVSNM